jgi:hypothetical protein
MSTDKITLIIPCFYMHFKYIEELLKIYEKQTLLVDEVVIPIAESNQLDKTLIDNLKKQEFKFPVNIIEIPKPSLAGNTRHIGLRRASHEIIIFQDADDIPHDQRVEMIKYFFDKYPEIVHICHKWSKRPATFNKTRYNIEKDIEVVIPKNNIFMSTYRQIEHIANGNIAIRKRIYKNVGWYERMHRKQDIQTNINIYNKYRKTLFIRAEIYLYRCENSSCKINKPVRNTFSPIPRKNNERTKKIILERKSNQRTKKIIPKKRIIKKLNKI